MRICCVLFVTALSGCGSGEEKPNPLEKADVPLPVVTMTPGHIPPSKTAATHPTRLTDAVTAGREFALEGTIEVGDPNAFHPEKLMIQFIAKRNDRRITARSHLGGVPIPDKGHQYRYRSALKAPPRPGPYLLEVSLRHEKTPFASARIVVEDAKK